MSVTTAHPALSNGATYLETISRKNITAGVSVTPASKGQNSSVPLAPESVSATSISGTITVKMTVYIDLNDTVNSLDIYEKPVTEAITDKAMLKTKPIYIVYNYTEETPSFLYPYTFSFTISDPNNSIDYIESYLYDKDPVTSSGTKTTVKRGMI